MDCSNSDTGHMEVQTKKDLDLQHLTNEISKLINSQLHLKIITKLNLMRQCTFYLDIRREVIPSSGGHQTPLYISDVTLWSLIDRQRLTQALSTAHNRVELLLTMLGLLTDQLSRSYAKLSAFMEKHRLGLLSIDEAASAQQTLEQTYQYAKDFDDTIERQINRINPRIKLIPNTGEQPPPRLFTSLMNRLPVVIDRERSSVKSSSVHLFWSIPAAEDQNQNEQFEVQVKSLHPTIGEEKFSSITSQLNLEVENLTPGRCYQLSVKRSDAVNQVYGRWIDSIVVKTLMVPGSMVKAGGGQCDCSHGDRTV